MEQNISEKSKLYKSAYMSKDEVLSLFGEDISNDKLSEFLDKYITVPTTELYEFILTCKDFTDKGVNLILNDDVKLFLRIRNHEQRGTWYDDNYTPYCAQNQIKCSGPRMQLTDYGYKCPECKNEISFTGVRLNESPLNSKHLKFRLKGSYALVSPNTNREVIKKMDKEIVEEITKTGLNKLKEDQSIGRYVRDEKEKVIATEKPTSMYPDVKRDLDSMENISKSVVQVAQSIFYNPEVVESITESGRNNLQMLKNAFEQKPIDDWIPLDQMLEHFKNSNNINIRVDTRDFGCIESRKNRFDELSHHTKDSIIKYFRRFMYTKDEVIECMKNAFEKSGGKGEWRMLNYKSYPETYNWQLKYLNIIYIGNNIQHSSDNNLQYIITSSDDRLLNKNMWNTEIDDDLLCFH